MAMDRVTITGADDSIEPAYLLELSAEFPWVEWGILISESRTGSPRFPSAGWRSRLQSLCAKTGVMLSAHLCGFWVRQLLLGVNLLPPSTLDRYQRVQLNFHAENTKCNPAKFAATLEAIQTRREWIFQIDGNGGNCHLENLGGESDIIDAVALFDISGGAGILPREWPAPQYLHIDPGPHGEGVESYRYHGYAGGLGPDNLAEQIPLIAKASKGCRFWIDMETRVRSEDDRQFDLAKVRRCLEIAAPFILGSNHDGRHPRKSGRLGCGL